jgi:death-on-curing protein
MPHSYLQLEDIVRIHAAQIAKFGGAPGIRDAGLIESALMRPQTGYYSDLVEEAAALWESLTLNHGFIDGNKRVGLAATYVFLSLNGLRISAKPEVLLRFIYAHLEAGTFNKDNLDAWLRNNTKSG